MKALIVTASYALLQICLRVGTWWKYASMGVDTRDGHAPLFSDAHIRILAHISAYCHIYMGYSRIYAWIFAFSLTRMAIPSWCQMKQSLMFQIHYTPDLVGNPLVSGDQIPWMLLILKTLNISLLLWNSTFSNSLFLPQQLLCHSVYLYTSPPVVPFFGSENFTGKLHSPLRFPFDSETLPWKWFVVLFSTELLKHLPILIQIM